MGTGNVTRWKKSVKRMGFPPFCASIFSLFYTSSSSTKTISCSAVNETPDNTQGNKEKQETTIILADKINCAICLDPLCTTNGTISSTTKSTKTNKSNNENNGKMFVAECSHSFHFLCIASNIRHGNLTCPICRAQWTQLPSDLKLPPFLAHHQNADPILRILDHSIATSRVNRRSSLRTVRYNDDDPIDPTTVNSPAPTRSSLIFSLIPLPSLNHNPNDYRCTEMVSSCQTRAYLSAQLAPQLGMDIILVVSANGPHIRHLKQCMALVIFSLRAIDRLAIVTYSTTATRAFPLRRMSPQGKRTALQVIDRISYTGGPSPFEGLQKGAKILEDRTHRNPVARILHLSDSPNHTHTSLELGGVQFPVECYDIGLGFGMPSELLMHEFEDFVSGMLGGVIRAVRLRIDDQIGWLRIGELHSGEERRIPLNLTRECSYVVVNYSYVEGRGIEEEVRSGEAVVCFEKNGRSDSDCEERETHLSMAVARRSCGDRWEYLDPFMVRRWAKHLHGYRAARGREDRCLV